MAECPHPTVTKHERGYRCSTCGAVLDRAGVMVESAPTPTTASSTAAAVPWLHPDGLLVVAVTVPLAGAIFAWFPWLNFIVSMLKTLSHEIGHTLAAWLLGRPAIPSFDLLHGGGVTRTWEPSIAVLVLWLVVHGGLLALAGRERWVRWAVGIVAGVQVLLLVSGWAEAAILSAGHGGECLAAGIFLFRALTAISVHHAAERWLYGVIGWIVLFQSASMPWGVIHQAALRDEYLAGKGGIDNDFVRLGDLGWGSLNGVAWFHWWLCLLTPVAVLGAAWLLRRLIPHPGER